MGIWNFLFGKPVKTNDAFFGEMLFMEVKIDPAKSYFEGWRHFEPINDNIEVCVSGSLSGPTQVQKDFFRQVENNYALLIRKVIPIVESRFQEWEAEFKTDNFGQKFKPVYIFIPDCVKKPLEWEIAFESMPELVDYNYPYVLTIEMIDSEPQHISVNQ